MYLYLYECSETMKGCSLSIALIMIYLILVHAEVVAISLDETAYSILENEQVVTVTLTLNDTYRQDIIVNLAVGELQGGCTESSQHVLS